MIWFDLVTPKCVMFFARIIEEVKKHKEVFVTAREGVGYKEVVELLRLHNIEHFNLGEFGGSSLEDKYLASLKRQHLLLDEVKKRDIEKLVCICSVDANRTAFGLGIPIYNFYDIPLSDHTADFQKALPQARLTLPLSTRVFHPYIVPKDIFLRFSMEENQIYTYNFLDSLMWMDNFTPDRKFYDDFLKSNDLDKDKYTIIIREEEYKASYVKKKYPFLYETLGDLKNIYGANIIIIPRYEVEYLQEEFPFATVLTKKIWIQHLLAYADLFIGGGGTINCEACHFGTPTISTRSFMSHYDKFIIDAGLMEKADNKEELLDKTKEIIGSRIDVTNFFNEMDLNMDQLIADILA